MAIIGRKSRCLSLVDALPGHKPESYKQDWPLALCPSLIPVFSLSSLAILTSQYRGMAGLYAYQGREKGMERVRKDTLILDAEMTFLPL
jgi:hypothetical protein